MPSAPANLTKLFELAMTHHQSGNLPEAERCYKAILEASPRQFDALHFLGVLQAQRGNAREAVKLIERALSINPQSAEANSNLGNVLLEARRPEEAAKYARKALAIQPANVQALYVLGNALRDLLHLDEALRSYEAALAINPRFFPALNSRGNVLKELNRPLEALASFEQALAITPDDPGILVNIGNAQHTLGRGDEAVAIYRKALAIKPDFAGAHNELGNALQVQGRLEEAIASIRRAISLKPDFAFAHNNLGNALQEQGKLDEAIASYRKALAFQPDFAKAHNNLGRALKAQGKLDDAVASYHLALSIDPNYADAHNSLALALREQGKLAEAVARLRIAISVEPELADSHNFLALALWDQGLLDEAIASARIAISLEPEYAEAHNLLGLALQDQGQHDEAIASYRKALACKPEFDFAYNNLLFCLNYHPDLPAQEIFAEYQRWYRQHARLLPVDATHANNRDAERRLRIGYVSPDLRRHSARHFIEPLLASHDKARVEVFAYAEVTREDEVTAKFKSYVDHWRRTVGLSDDEMADLIRADGVDILVDLAGHTRGNRLPVFVRKPAPIQVSWLGFGYTTGLDAMDYLLADAEFAPVGCESLFTEKLVRLPAFAAYRPAEGMGETGPLPALQTRRITFGTLSRSVRINHRVIRAWAGILNRLPDARLVIDSFHFQTAEMQARFRDQFGALGIAVDRLTIGFSTPPWDVLRRIDISLDCFPHNSGTTLYESVYMGVPYITLAERPSVGRLGSAILTALGHPEWIATTEAEYIDKAVALATDIEHLAEIRASLRDRMRQSKLMNEPAFARSVESAYREMWRAWCNRPDS